MDRKSQMYKINDFLKLFGAITFSYDDLRSRGILTDILCFHLHPFFEVIVLLSNNDI